MDLDRILNEALNEAMCIESKRIKQPNSNEIAQFVMDFMERKNLKNDSLHSVSVPFPSDKLIEERGKEFESKTYYNLEEGEKIGDFEVGAKWVVDYLQGNER